MGDILKPLDLSILDASEREFYLRIRTFFPPGEKKFTMNDVPRSDWAAFEGAKSKGFITGCDPSEWIVNSKGRKVPSFEVVESN